MLTVTKRSFTRRLRSRRIVPSMKSSRMWPPSSGGIGSKIQNGQVHADHGHQGKQFA